MSTVALAVTGGFIPSSLTFQGQSVSYNVTAKVAAPLPTDPANILSPQDQDRFSDPTIDVSGNCPNDSYVKVFQNNQLAGISPCTSLTFSVTTILSPGANILRAQVYNLTDDEGPTSPSITVHFDAPQPPASEASTVRPAQPSKPSTPITPQPENPSASGITIVLEGYRYQRLKPNEPWQWNIAIRGGEKPYKAIIDWRDSTTQQLERTDEGFFNISHAYSSNGIYMPFIRATDAAGNTASLQLYADVHSEPVTIPHVQTAMSPWIVGSLYFGVSLVIAQFWIWEIRAWHKTKIRRAGKHV